MKELDPLNSNTVSMFQTFKMFERSLDLIYNTSSFVRYSYYTITRHIFEKYFISPNKILGINYIDLMSKMWNLGQLYLFIN